MQVKTKWDDLFKIKLSSIVDESVDKHDIIKLLIVRKLLRKYTKRKWIRIYTEYKLNGLIPDVFFENIKTKSVICYEIQKNFSKKWIKTKTEQYNNYKIYNFTLDFIPINLNNLSDNIFELNKQLDQYIF